MKKRFKLLFVLVVLSVVTALSVACGDAYKPNPYTAFNGVDSDAVVELDEGITLDGQLNEDIWLNSETVIDIEGAVKDQMTGGAIDIEEYGERSATVYTHIGDKAIYWAFEVQDKNLYFNFYRAQGANSGVEVYFANSKQATFTEGCYSVRVNPTGNGTETYIGMYQPKYIDGVISNVEKSKENGGNTWQEMMNMRGKVVAAASVDGQVKNAANQSIDMDENAGYVIEIAVDKALLGDLNATDMIYTAAFCQARNFTLSRLNNSFITGTSYLAPNTWKLVTNDGYVADKYSYWDENVETDDNVIIDGQLNDALWDGVQGRTFESNKHKRSLLVGESEFVKYTTKAVTTDKGVYIGLESNDAKVYYYPNANNYYSTGAEVMISVGGDTTVNENTTRQIRFLVGGKGKRYYGKQTPTEYAYTEHYFPAKTAGYVVNGEVGSSDADGWTGEIFIPWSSFNLKAGAPRDVVAILANGYYAYEFDGTPTDRAYVASVDSVSFSNGGTAVNPQEKWFVFKNNQPAYDFSVQDVVLDNDSLVGGYYETTVLASYSDNVVTANGKEIFPTVTGGIFNFDASLGVSVTDNGDGTYKLRIPQNKAGSFNNETRINFSVGARTQDISVVVDEEFVIDGILDEHLWYYLNKLETTQTNGLSANTSFTVALRENAMYLSAKITDYNFDKYRNSSALGLELYVNTGNSISAETTRQIRIVSNSSSVSVYQYVENGNDWPWSTPEATGKVKFCFTSNNDGSYAVEARIPYEVIGLNEMPYSIEVAPFTKFVKNADTGAISTKLINWEGNQYTYDQAFYQTFDCEVGYAPDKVVIANASGQEVDGIEIIKGLGIGNSGNYEGTVILSLYPEGGQALTDVNFGNFNKYFTHIGSGNYQYSIPKSALTSDEITLNLRSISTTLRTEIGLYCTTLSEMYFNAEGSNLYAVDRIGNNYVFSVRISADQRGQVPLTGVTFESGWNAVENGNGVYTFTVPKSTIESASTHTVTASVTLEGVTVESDVTFNYIAWSEEELDKVKTYLDFNGNVTDKKGSTVTAGAGSTITYVDGTGLQGVELQNPDSGNSVKKNVNVAQSLGSTDFTMSFDFKLDASAIGVFATQAQYELVNSGTTVDTGKDTFQISAYDYQKKSTGFRIQLGAYGGDSRYATYQFYELGIASEKWYNFTLLVDRNYTGSNGVDEKVAVSLYINGVLQKTNIVTLESGQVLGNGNIALGGDYWAYDSGQRLLQMDNFVFYDGLFTSQQISDVAVRAKNLS